MKKSTKIPIAVMSVLLLAFLTAGMIFLVSNNRTSDLEESTEATQSAASEETDTVHGERTAARIAVISTSDIHGYLMDTTGGDESAFQYRMAYIAMIVNDMRTSGDYDDVLLIDDGDIFQGSPVSNLTQGAALRACLDMMLYDAVALGNHEFDWGLETTLQTDGTLAPYSFGNYSGDPSIPVLACNLFTSDTNTRSDYTKDYVIVEKAGYRIALIGYIPDYSEDIMRSRIEPYSIHPDYTEFSARIREIREAEHPDITIVMAHNKPDEVSNALDHEDVDLVTGGHKHKGIYGIADSGIPYIQADCYAQGYASAVILIDSEGNVDIEDIMYTSIMDEPELLYDTPENETHLDPQILALSHAAWNEIRDEMAEYLGYIDSSIQKKGYIDGPTTTGGNFITGLMLECMRDEGVVAAFYNRGGFRADVIVPEGETVPLTVGDIYAIVPFNNTWLVYDLTGEELAQQLVKGFVESNCGDQVSGLTYEYNNYGTEDEPDIQIVSITLSDGTPVDIHGTEPVYRVCTSNYNATIEGGVFEGKTPVIPEAEAPIDHEALIELLRSRRDGGEEHIPTNNDPRGVCLNAYEAKAAA